MTEKPKTTLSELVKRIHDSLMHGSNIGSELGKAMLKAPAEPSPEPMTHMHLAKPTDGIGYIPFGVGRIELPPEAGDLLGVVAQTGNIVVLDCTHGVVTISFPGAFDWSTEPQVKVDLLPMPTAGMGF